MLESCKAAVSFKNKWKSKRTKNNVNTMNKKKLADKLPMVIKVQICS